jgi:hypothetical protein
LRPARDREAVEVDPRSCGVDGDSGRRATRHREIPGQPKAAAREDLDRKARRVAWGDGARLSASLIDLDDAVGGGGAGNALARLISSAKRESRMGRRACADMGTSLLRVWRRRARGVNPPAKKLDAVLFPRTAAGRSADGRDR